MTPLKLGWLAWEADHTSGYAHVGHKIRMGFQNKGVEFVNSYLRGWDALVAVCTPTAWVIGETSRKRKDVVFHTMFEASPLPQGWVQNMNDAGLIWVPSQWCMDEFRAQGVTSSMMVAGYGVDHSIYRYHERSGRETPLKFVIWGDTLPSRKGVLTGIRAFIKAEIPNATLEVKLHDLMGVDEGSTLPFTWEGKVRDDVILHIGAWPTQRVVAWMHEADCLIYPSGGEGFGFKPLECAATGMPVICANNSGMTEYLRDDSYLLIDCPEKELSTPYKVSFNEDLMVFKPNFDQIVEKIQWVATNREAAYARGKLGFEQSVNWNWGRSIDSALLQLQTYVDFNCR